ncbi:MAG: VanW family protein [uncultured bacterium]|uniref:VanW family protein n=1 Tax=Candidatus Uhrbacteria bacterium GW2011_GWC1_41_20 TaxID=1618983 RepID=A0A0G0VG73_9BACT|nr:MAG: VanW family protein [uncultured bacterium]KKR23239.1 MAG: VanW family protein [Candidatus Uhrbacteria bacterium GW2011_GWE1_39_46]KKR64421.1 MAG: VanW family protein [Candidatus Uhrbacteria bacterium GW2011_GWC2_40_450]KKR90700.1 MAG: hypothetical protein UU40_C0001G0038 [Candidatus Uhrbacteria bacterium GW2011_GWD2_41_121]KKR96583.1 MAG: VanW family protein [Candidatus Uhrbacteria bacterium GW2011_GWD1_41_16]KKR99974.1 MAG: VanW family protein [Candidatus Uhrbacteria bacterium GW2011_
MGPVGPIFMQIEMIKTKARAISAHKKPILITSSALIFIVLILAASSYAYAKAYEGRVLPHVYVGVVDVGELSQADATEVLQQHIDNLLSAGVDISVDGHTGHLDLQASVFEEPDLAHDILNYNVSEEIDVAMGVGRGDSFWRNIITPISLLLKPEVLQVLAEMDEDDIREQIQDQFGELETPALPADYKIDLTNKETPVRFLPGQDGIELDLLSAIPTLWDDAQDLDLQPLKIALRDVTYEMTSADALSLTSDILATLDSAPYYLTYTSETLREYLWEIEADDLADWIEPFYTVDDNYQEIPAIHFAGVAYEDFVQDISNDVNINPINARFEMKSGIVTEFAGSQDGIKFDADATMWKLLGELGNEDVIIDLVVINTPPQVSIADVNDFGINEILGVGTSDFSGSPSNRIANIQHGASKLNGLLIAPGETISLIEKLRPFTIADGYLAELVIKGDEIKPEVGGGLCQIGTTTFRAVMNAGLQVDQRSNHSLVVSYYNDPANGNPGTDATIYDPYPDFRFTNDYENYILLTTQVDVPNRDIIFTFWGTDDGRDGYYTPPVVLSWSGYGEPQYTETLDLNPGVTSCQSPHPGATTQFTYYVDYADKTQFSQVYTSVYRSLPKICLIGVEELTTPSECPEGEVCEEIDEIVEETSDDIEVLEDPVVE